MVLSALCMVAMAFSLGEQSNMYWINTTLYSIPQCVYQRWGWEGVMWRGSEGVPVVSGRMVEWGSPEVVRYTSSVTRTADVNF